MHDNPLDNPLNNPPGNLRGNPLDQETPSHSADEPLDHHLDHLDELDRRIIRALEAAPRPYIPAGFAARIAQQLPEKRPESLTPTHYGQWAVLIGTLASFAALLILARSSEHAGHATFGLVESFLFAQFIALAVWFSVWRPSLR